MLASSARRQTKLSQRFEKAFRISFIYSKNDKDPNIDFG